MRGRWLSISPQSRGRRGTRNPQFFPDAQRPSRTNLCVLVAGVGGRYREPRGQSLCHSRGIVGNHGRKSVDDAAGETAVAHAHVIAVPAGHGQPDLEFYVRVNARLDHALNAAKRWQSFERRQRRGVGSGSGRHKGSRRDDLRRGDRSFRQLQGSQAFASGCAKRNGQKNRA